MNRNFTDMLCALSDAEAEYLVVGAHALAAHGHPRATGDLDIWVGPSAANAQRVWKALVAFGAPLTELSPADLEKPGSFYRFGIAPEQIDILTDIKGVAFADAWNRRDVLVVDGLSLPFLNREDFIASKKAAGRLKDLADVEELEARQPER